MIPVAWLQLKKEKLRLAAAGAGIAFAAILILVQLGFRDALLNSAGLNIARMNCDLVLASAQYQYLLSPGTFTERRLYQALAFPEVQSIESIYCGRAAWKNPVDHRESIIFMMGFKPKAGVFDLAGVDDNIERLRDENTVLFDVSARPEYGPVEQMYGKGARVESEILGRKLEVAGLFRLGTSFGIDGNLMMSDQNFLRLFPSRQPQILNLGLIRLKPGADAGAVRLRMAAALPLDVQVETHEGLLRIERSYWNTHTPVGFVFMVGLVMGFFVGAIVVYQILYTDVANHLSEYATLKAMGYRDRQLFSIVVEEAAILSAVGYVPGLIVAWMVYGLAAKATHLPMVLHLDRVFSIYLLVAFMCAASGALAARKLRSAEPAEIF